MYHSQHNTCNKLICPELALGRPPVVVQANIPTRIIDSNNNKNNNKCTAQLEMLAGIVFKDSLKNMIGNIYVYCYYYYYYKAQQGGSMFMVVFVLANKE